MVDYSKFDNLEIDSEDEDDKAPIAIPQQQQVPPPPTKKTKTTKDGRYVFEYNGQTIYEWEQSLDECNIYINTPPGVTRDILDVSIGMNNVQIGIKNEKPFINEATGGAIILKESYWTFDKDSNEININLQKMRKGENWASALGGATSSSASLDEFTKEEQKKKLLLERFQEEHPGFDFSGADFNGQVPDARAFMGGIPHL